MSYRDGADVAEVALLLHRRRLGVSLDHDQPAQEHRPVLAGHFLPGRLTRDGRRRG